MTTYNDTQDRIEQETVIRWDRTGRPATLYTAHPTVRDRSIKRGYKLIKTDTSNSGIPRGWTFELPVKAVTLRNLTISPAKKSNNPTFGRKTPPTPPATIDS